MPSLLQLDPLYDPRVWGGQRLKASPEKPIGEAWVVYECNPIASGPLAGRTLAEVAAERGAALVGRYAFERTGTRFPLLIKLLDCADWLSIQVHPNDEQAIRMEGAGQFGKTEAWHVLEADEGAQLIAGVRPGTSAEELAQAIRSGGIEPYALYHTVHAGDTIFMPAGLMHALGPGLLLYEVQQTSDLTYRVFDWNRPASAGRPLHIEQSVAVTNPELAGKSMPLPPLAAHDQRPLVHCKYFDLSLLVAQQESFLRNTQGESFHALTVIEGKVDVRCGDEQVTLGRFGSVVVCADAGVYSLDPLTTCRVLCACVPPEG
jgi:mannose-6-phosphate isomerase